MPRQPAERLGHRLVVPLCVGAVANPVNSTMIAPALTSIARDLGVGVGVALGLVTAMYVASALGQPLAGRLSDVMGPRRVFLAGAVLVAAAGVLGALATSFGVLFAARVLVGLGTAAAYPSALTVIRDRDRARALGLPEPAGALRALSTTSLLTLTLGPVVGGLLVQWSGWRATFLVNVALGVLTLALSVGALPRDRPWSTVPWGRLDPLTVLDVRMIARNPPLARTYLRFVLTFTVIYAVLFGYPQWLEQVRGFPPAASGAVMLALSGVGAVLVLGAGRSRGVRGPLLVGAVGMLAGGAALLVVDATAALPLVVLVPVLFGLPQGLNSVTNQLTVYRQAPEEGLGTATGLSRTAQYVGAMLATGLLALAYGEQATDGGLAVVGAVCAAVAVGLLVLTATDRALRRG